jgi:hypothetical protein
MSEKEPSPEWVGKSFTTDRTTIRSFTGEASEPTPLPADTPYSIAGNTGGGEDPSAGAPSGSDGQDTPSGGGAEGHDSD